MLAWARSLASPFALLTAEWRNLVVLNYEIDPDVLAPYVPYGTELDTWKGKTFVSLVGFEFLRARFRGLSIPLHHNFPEVNLRFYVRRETSEGMQRGVVFIREIAPRWIVAQIARRVYHENYICRPMRHGVHWPMPVRGDRARVWYAWRQAGAWHRLGLEASGPPRPVAADSLARFVVDRSQCYTARPDGSTYEYPVEHPPWRMWPATLAGFNCDVARVYGPQFVECLGRKPESAMLLDGSAVVVRPGQVLAHSAAGAYSVGSAPCS
jgi:hypothetical protein